MNVIYFIVCTAILVMAIIRSLQLYTDLEMLLDAREESDEKEKFEESIRHLRLKLYSLLIATGLGVIGIVFITL